MTGAGSDGRTVRTDARRLVAAAAVVRDGRVLAVRRRFPEALAGRWEFPGGKVEPGESPEAALARELIEELQLPVRALGEVPAPGGGSWPIDDRLHLRLWWAVPEPVTAQPVLGDDHDQLCWLELADLHRPDWLPADRPMVAELRRHGLPV